MSSFIAATIGLPSLALAAPQRDQVPAAQGPVDPNGLAARNRGLTQPSKANAPDSSLGGGASSGSGAVGGNEPGHVAGPGTTPIDPESRGPINDVDPGRGTTDTHQNAKPKPVR